jgi:hypothetical protein
LGAGYREAKINAAKFVADLAGRSQGAGVAAKAAEILSVVLVKEIYW